MVEISLSDQLYESIAAIHATKPLVVIEFAGAGARSLAWLHSVGGSSRTVLEATDRYGMSSIYEAINYRPDAHVRPKVALDLATSAYSRAVVLAKADGSDVPVAGIGCTATIATDRIRLGEHHGYVALCTENFVSCTGITFDKNARTRQEEEDIISLMIVRAVGDMCGVTTVPHPHLLSSETIIKHFEPADLPTRLLRGDLEMVLIPPTGHMTTMHQLSNIAFLSGSFNPLHEGHEQLASIARDILGRPVYFEIPVINADKAPLTLEDTRQRMKQFAGKNTLLLTTAPLFSHKAEMFPYSVFVIGADTAKRLVQPRFYNNDPDQMRTALGRIHKLGCRFLVAGRVNGNEFLTLRDIQIPPEYRRLFDEIPEQLFRLDISSTLIRAGHQPA